MGRRVECTMGLTRFKDFDKPPSLPFAPSPLRPFAPPPLRHFAASPRLLLILAICLALSALAAGCKRDAKQSLERAVEAWDSRDYKLAAEEYEHYLSLDPASDKAVEARFQLANIYYFNLHQYDQARTHYSAFLNENSSHINAPLARERLAEVLGEMGRSYDAIAEYET